METLLHAGLSNAVSATFLALLVACLGRVLARRPAVLHCLWLLVLLKLVTPPLYEVSIPWPSPLTTEREPARPLLVAPYGPTDGTRSFALAAAEPGAFRDLATGEMALEMVPAADGLFPESPARAPGAAPGEWSWSDWVRSLALFWLAGTITTLVVAARRIRRFQLVLREARPAALEIQEWVDELAINLGLRRPPSVWWIGGKLSPLVWSLGVRPRLIIPTDLWKSLDDRQRTTLIVHELAHLRRGDHHVRIFELVVTALYWWHPVLWWVRQALRDVEEQCCDAWVVWAYPDAAKSYAETLLETLDFLNQSPCPEPLLASGFGKVHHLRRRLTMIMSGTTPRLLGIWGALGSLVLAALLLPVNATWAQKPEEKQQVRVIVKTDDDSKSADAVARIESDEPRFVFEEVVDPSGASKPEVVQLEVRSDHATAVVTADSMDEAIAKLKDQIKSIAKKSPASDKQKAMQKTLEKVLKDLEKVSQSGKGTDSSAGASDAKRQVVVRLRNVERSSDSKPSGEKKKEIEQAQARVKKLSQALASMQKQLTEAQRKLSQLKGASLDIDTIHTDVFVNKPVREIRVPDKATTTANRELRITSSHPGHSVASAPTSDRKRLEDLEKKLDRLLEEVASLKKARVGADH